MEMSREDQIRKLKEKIHELQERTIKRRQEMYSAPFEELDRTTEEEEADAIACIEVCILSFISFHSRH